MTNTGKERRKAERKQVLDSFQVFLTFPGKSQRRIVLKDLNALGFGFLSEGADYFEEAEKLDCFFHINPGLKLPLQIQIAHTQDGFTGCEITEKTNVAYKTYLKFAALLDDLSAFLD